VLDVMHSENKSHNITYKKISHNLKNEYTKYSENNRLNGECLLKA